MLSTLRTAGNNRGRSRHAAIFKAVPDFFTAAARQTVTIDFTPAATLDVSMMGPDNSHHVDNDAGRLETVLPQTGEYILDVIAMNAENGVRYQFTITIQ